MYNYIKEANKWLIYMKYKLLLRDVKEINERQETEIVGAFIDNMNNKLILPIIMENEEITKIPPYYECELSMKTNNDFCIIISKSFYNRFFKQRPDYFKCSVLHELGHFVNQDLINGYGKKEAEERRYNDVINGVPTQEEINADLYALKYVDKTLYLNSLSYLKKYLKSIPAMPIEEKELALKEVQIRFDYLSANR